MTEETKSTYEQALEQADLDAHTLRDTEMSCGAKIVREGCRDYLVIEDAEVELYKTTTVKDEKTGKEVKVRIYELEYSF